MSAQSGAVICSTSPVNCSTYCGALVKSAKPDSPAPIGSTQLVGSVRVQTPGGADGASTAASLYSTGTTRGEPPVIVSACAPTKANKATIKTMTTLSDNMPPQGARPPCSYHASGAKLTRDYVHQMARTGRPPKSFVRTTITIALSDRTRRVHPQKCQTQHVDLAYRLRTSLTTSPICGNHEASVSRRSRLAGRYPTPPDRNLFV